MAKPEITTQDENLKQEIINVLRAVENLILKITEIVDKELKRP